MKQIATIKLRTIVCCGSTYKVHPYKKRFTHCAKCGTVYTSEGTKLISTQGGQLALNS